MLYVLCSACASSVKVSSVPESIELHSINALTGSETLIGSTPATLAPGANQQDYHLLKMSKSGFLSQYTVIPFTSSFKTEPNVKVTLKKKNSTWFDAALRGVYAKETDDIIREFLELQKKIIANDEFEGNRLIGTMKQKYANIAAFHSLVGAFHWKKNNLTEARRSYERILELVPQDAEALKMLSVISVMMGQ